MSAIHRFSAHVIDYAERASNMADAAEGKGSNGMNYAGALVLPEAGAGVYALVKSDYFSPQAKSLREEATSFAAELPDDLMARVHQISDGNRKTASDGNGSSRGNSASTRRRSTGRTSSQRGSSSR